MDLSSAARARGQRVLNRYLVRRDGRRPRCARRTPVLCHARRDPRQGHRGARRRRDCAIRRCAERAMTYFALPRTSAPPAPRLVAVGGLSGTGKSLLARALGPDILPHPAPWAALRRRAQGAVRRRRDRSPARKRLCAAMSPPALTPRSPTRPAARVAGRSFGDRRRRVLRRRRARRRRGRRSRDRRGVRRPLSYRRSRDADCADRPSHAATPPTPTPRSPAGRRNTPWATLDWSVDRRLRRAGGDARSGEGRDPGAVKSAMARNAAPTPFQRRGGFKRPGIFLKEQPPCKAENGPQRGQRRYDVTAFGTIAMRRLHAGLASNETGALVLRRLSQWSRASRPLTGRSVVVHQGAPGGAFEVPHTGRSATPTGRQRGPAGRAPARSEQDRSRPMRLTPRRAARPQRVERDQERGARHGGRGDQGRRVSGTRAAPRARCRRWRAQILPHHRRAGSPIAPPRRRRQPLAQEHRVGDGLREVGGAGRGEMETWAAASAGASLRPSPTMRTLAPFACSSASRATLSAGFRPRASAHAEGVRDLGDRARAVAGKDLDGEAVAREPRDHSAASGRSAWRTGRRRRSDRKGDRRRPRSPSDDAARLAATPQNEGGRAALRRRHAARTPRPAPRASSGAVGSAARATLRASGWWLDSASRAAIASRSGGISAAFTSRAPAG